MFSTIMTIHSTSLSTHSTHKKIRGFTTSIMDHIKQAYAHVYLIDSTGYGVCVVNMQQLDMNSDKPQTY